MESQEPLQHDGEAIQQAIKTSTMTLTTTTNPPTRKDKEKKIKRTLQEGMADISNPKTVIFDPFCVSSKHPAILHLPSNIDTNDPYALFSLFWPERIWTTITANTNIYAIDKRIKSTEDRIRP